LKHDFLAPLGLSAYRVAKDLGVSLPTVNDIVRRRRAVTAEMALRFARYFGTSAPSSGRSCRRSTTSKSPL
jgi:addiction module HigA family antidote